MRTVSWAPLTLPVRFFLLAISRGALGRTEYLPPIASASLSRERRSQDSTHLAPPLSENRLDTHPYILPPKAKPFYPPPRRRGYLSSLVHVQQRVRSLL
ncbi:hypothetical protein CONLIGDRAFT_319845 [Coniochaeta ligniaria NRRL 30616]|uniref:Secreted protein n=1 Tax=Coniochaeta ligniaria NRRL 30616 TaxID=1408157 RepID=A0A1J7IZ98_9PEZI|nr:hypothetical protein CONLIGDRAFT_319845 [Coniochaeta ligniaria NRRL 30616]